MRRLVFALLSLGVIAVAFTVLAQGEVSAPVGASSGSVAVNPWADRTAAVARVQEYLQRDKRESTLDTTREFPVIDVPVKMTNATHHLRIVIDTKRQIVYMFLNRYLEAKPDSAQLPKVLQRLMEENWNLNIGKFEWDKTDGEIRLSYCFTTENGIGYEAFSAIVTTLTETGDKLWPELHALTTQ
jgi:hypothetical protein